MVVLCIGLQKSGSSWFFNLVNDILIESGFADARDVKERFNLQGFMKYLSCEVQDLSEENLGILTSPPVSDFTFAVKTHGKPNPVLLEKIDEGKVVPLMIVRDPRDMIISVVDAGKILRARGVFERFGRIHTKEEALKMAVNVVGTWSEWRSAREFPVFRYEDMLTRPVEQMERITGHLGHPLPESTLLDIYERYLPENIEKTGHGHLHFNKGIIGRYRDEMTRDEIEQCNEIFSDYMKAMNYMY